MEVHSWEERCEEIQIMSTDSTLPKDPQAAAEMLAALPLKDQNDTICRYPTCYNPRRAETGTGRPSAYCDNAEHTALSNHRARASLKAIASGATQETTGKREQPVVGAVPVESLRSAVLQAMTHLNSGLERYISTLVEIADPDIAASQIQAVQDRAEARIADAHQAVSTEHSLRLAAESASVAARQEAHTEREAAELAIQHMEEAEARTVRIQEEAEQHIAAVQTERDETVRHIRDEARQQIEETFQQAKEAVAIAETATATAQEGARLANSRAHDAEVDARTRIETAEHVVREANATLQRERSEVDRLRAELATTITEARTRAEAERAEATATLQRERTEVDRLRGELVSVTTNARDQATVDRLEMDRLRAELVTARTRADRFAELNETLRTQLLERQNPSSQT